MTGRDTAAGWQTAGSDPLDLGPSPAAKPEAKEEGSLDRGAPPSTVAANTVTAAPGTPTLAGRPGLPATTAAADVGTGSPEVVSTAETLVAELLAAEPTDGPARDAARRRVETLGRDAQATANRRARLLDVPVRGLAGGTDDEVTRALAELRAEVDRLDPAGLDLAQSWLGRAVGRLPGGRTPAQRYFGRFETSQLVLDRILRSLQQGRDQLRRDIVTLEADQDELRVAIASLTEQVGLGQAVDRGLEEALSGTMPGGERQRELVRDDFLYLLRQRTIDLQQQLTVTQQGVLALDVLARNSRELVRGVDRALNVTVAALDVAVTVALGLAQQRLVLDKVEAVTARVPELTRQVGRNLRTHGVDTHRRAAETGKDLTALREAFADINRTLDEIDSYQQEASPSVGDSLLDLDRVIEQPTSREDRP